MKRRVIVTAAAEADVDRLWAYLVVRDPAAAVRAVDMIEAAVLTLTEFSERGRSGPIKGYRELSIPFGKGEYVARYRVSARTVVVTRIHHSNEDRSR